MDSGDFDRVVAEFMNEMGGTATLVVQDPNGLYDPTTSTYTATTTLYTVKAILLDLTLRSNGLTTQPNTLIETGDKRCLIQPLNKTTTGLIMPVLKPNKDKIIMGGVTYKIVTLKNYNPSAVNSILIDTILRE